MVALQSFFVVIFLSIFSSKSTFINGAEVRLSAHDNFDVNRGRPYSADFALKPVYNPSAKLTYTTGSSKLDDIPSNLKIRLSLCCHLQAARKHGICLTNDTRVGKVARISNGIDGHIDQEEVSERSFDLLIGDPCNFDWMVPSMLNNFFVMKNGSIRDADFSEGSVYDIEHYCLFRYPESDVYLARVCYPLVVRSGWEVFCAIVIILISLAVFIVHSVIPEGKNLPGMMFRSYIGTYGIIAVAVVAVEFTTESRTNAYLYSFADTTVRYGAGSCACWLNAMNFNIWRSIRSLRRIDSYTRESERRKFFGYAVYAWGTPVIALMAILLPAHYLPYLGHEIAGYDVRVWAYVGVVTVIYTSNAIFSISTVLTIRHHKKDTASVVNGVHRHNNSDEEWFNLYVKLFVLMGGHFVMWIIWLLKPTQTIIHILGALEMIQAILIFVIFVWKDNVKRSFRERLLAASTNRGTKISHRRRDTITLSHRSFTIFSIE